MSTGAGPSPQFREKRPRNDGSTRLKKSSTRKAIAASTKTKKFLLDCALYPWYVNAESRLSSAWRRRLGNPSAIPLREFRATQAGLPASRAQSPAIEVNCRQHDRQVVPQPELGIWDLQPVRKREGDSGQACNPSRNAPAWQETSVIARFHRGKPST